jgi:hypothetical protein
MAVRMVKSDLRFFLMVTGGLYMKIELQSMTRKELRAYIMSNPNDVEAFHLWVDLVTAKPLEKIYPPARTPADIAEVDRLLREKIAQNKAKSR